MKNTDADVAQREIPQQLENLTATALGLSETITELEARIAPVMSDEL